MPAFVFDVTPACRFARAAIAASALGCSAASAWASQLVYYGGPVVGNVQVVQVNWSSQVSDTVRNSMPAFYADIVTSDYLSILHEYATTINGNDGLPGSNQQIGPGSFAGAFTLSPSKCSSSNTCYLEDYEVTNEISAQITAGVLPAPQSDGSGHANTVYMVHLPPNITLDQQGATSCAYFCATYGNIVHGALEVAIGMIADQETTACAGACANVPVGLPSETIVASNALGDLITDPLLPSAPSYNERPSAWFDPNLETNGGQVAQKCNAIPTSASVNGHAYTVTELWSNARKACSSVGSIFRTGFDNS